MDAFQIWSENSAGLLTNFNVHTLITQPQSVFLR